MLLHVPDVLLSDQVADLRRRLADAEWVDGRATVGEQGARVKRNRQLDEFSPTGQELGRVVLKALLANPLYLSAALPLRHMPPLFNCYEGGEHYGLHVDGAIRSVPGTTLQMRTDLSCTLFLSGPHEYDGGELEIVDTYGTHEVKLPAGDLVLYPSSSLHRVHPVTRGARVASFFWVQSLVRDTARRRALFELDQNIQALRAQVGDNEAVLGLTGHYHNLVRAWSEV
ncbi:MAG TPA: Fe2+-dependent dioxygenase [Burkholderiaceae bacterium]